MNLLLVLLFVLWSVVLFNLGYYFKASVIKREGDLLDELIKDLMMEETKRRRSK